MAKSNFFKMVFFIGSFCTFAKVYQSNRCIKKNYEKQRLENAFTSCLKKIDEATIVSLKLRNNNVITRWASLENGMQHFTISRLIVASNDEKK